MKVRSCVIRGVKRIFLFCLILVIGSYRPMNKFEFFAFNPVLQSNALDVEESVVMDTVDNGIEDVLNEVEEVEVVEVQDIKNKKSTVLENKSGIMTAYSADCKGCSGHLACTSYNVYKNNVVTFYDNSYGSVRIVASSSVLPCGSIIKIHRNSVFKDSLYAIVLDRGVKGNAIDLLVENEQVARKKVGRVKINYDVMRYGW